MQYSIVGMDGRQYGPVDVNQLYQWALEGRITPDMKIIDHTTNNTFPASAMPELSAVFSTPNQHTFHPSPPPPYQGGPQYYPPQYPNGFNPYPNGNLHLRQDGKPYKNKYVAGLLGIFLGALGIHRFYLGYNSIGLVMLLVTLILGYFGGGLIMAIWGIIDGVMCLTGNMRDADGYPLIG
jgi:TM2 domain-containing membrane protein YozV